MANQDDREKPWYAPKDTPNFVVGLLTLIAVCFYTGYARQQVTETQTANAIAKRALAEVNKPYVNFASIYPNFTKDTAGEHFRVGFALINNGNTPANSVVFTNCDPIIKDGDVTPLMNCVVSEASVGENIIGPRQTLNFSGPIIDVKDFDATEDAKKSIYILGYVKYKDDISFDESGKPETRVTRFCQRVVKPGVSTLAAQTSVLFKPPADSAETSVSKPTDKLPRLPMIVGAIGCPAFSCTDKNCPLIP